jgi:hypothetical protein
MRLKPYDIGSCWKGLQVNFRVRTAPGIPGISLKKKLILNNPEMSLISRQYSANPWNVLEFYKS